MPTHRKQPNGLRPIIQPGGAFRTSAQVAAMNDINSPDRLPEHPTLIVADDGEGYAELLAEIMKYNAVDQDTAEMFVQRELIDPALSRPNDRVYETAILGVKARFVKQG